MSGPKRLPMKYGVAYDPEFWGEMHTEPFATFSWRKDAERFARLVRETEFIDVVVVDL